MANPFSINIITAAGTALIAQATSTNPIVFVDALTGTSAGTDGADLATKTASWYDGEAGFIEGCSATDSVARIVVKFGNVAGSSSQIVKSVCVRGRLQNQSEGQEVIVAAMSDDNSSIYIPPSTSPSQYIRIPFNIVIGADEDVETTAADSVGFSDLDRFVSMHKAGQPLTGEAQTIRGRKRFVDGIDIDTHFSCGSESLFDDNMSLNGSIFISDDIVPVENNVSGLGNSDYPFHDAYISTMTNNLFFTNNIFVGPITTQSNPPSIGSAEAPFNVGYINSLHGDLVGKIPFPSINANTLSLPVGGICLAYIVNVDFGYDDMTGRQFTITSRSTNYKSVVFDGSGSPSAGSYSLPSGTYQCLGGGRTNSSVGSFMALVMRIA